MSSTTVPTTTPEVDEPCEYGIPVMFDITADSRADAAQALVLALTGLRSPGLIGRTVTVDVTEAVTTTGTVESWWLIEAEDKKADGNDNSPGRIVFDSEPHGYLVEWFSSPALGVQHRYWDTLEDAQAFAAKHDRSVVVPLFADRGQNRVTLAADGYERREYVCPSCDLSTQVRDAGDASTWTVIEHRDNSARFCQMSDCTVSRGSLRVGDVVVPS